jgi:CRISPR/Cas system-associated exonuclease Cas4 (RecB family)
MIALIEAPERSVESILDEPVSASRLNLFHSCRLKFFFRYVEKISKPSSPALHVGKAVHHSLQEWSNRRWRGEASTIEDLRESFDECWCGMQENEPVSWDDGGDEEIEMEKAWGLVQHYLQETPIPPDEKPLAVEVSVECDLSSHGLPVLRGVIDLIRPGGVIVDFKTSATTPSTAQVLHRNETQLTCYAELYREATGEREKGFELHHLIKTKVPKLIVTSHKPATDKQRSRLFRSIESFIDGVEREDFVPSPGLQCSSCEYFQECRGGAL